jgi:hypothetical protein
MATHDSFSRHHRLGLARRIRFIRTHFFLALVAYATCSTSRYVLALS